MDGAEICDRIIRTHSLYTVSAIGAQFTAYVAKSLVLSLALRLVSLLTSLDKVGITMHDVHHLGLYCIFVVFDSRRRIANKIYDISQ